MKPQRHKFELGETVEGKSKIFAKIVYIRHTKSGLIDTVMQYVDTNEQDCPEARLVDEESLSR